MQIFVDADACPVVGIVEEIAEKYSIPATLLCDTNHVLYSDYSEVIVVGAGADAVDYKLISICHKGDVVVSQDYGVAAMALGKEAYAIHQSGKWYTNENIDQMLMERHLNKKARRSSHKNHMKGPRKRTEKDDVRFAQSFEKLIRMAKSNVTIKEFYEIIYSKHEEKLDAWLVKLEKFNILELQTYVNGIRQDIVAVKNGISMQYNNGLAEGSVNKLKVIKRIMYGRNSFELLKAKVLLHEQFRCEIN